MHYSTTVLQVWGGVGYLLLAGNKGAGQLKRMMKGIK